MEKISISRRDARVLTGLQYVANSGSNSKGPAPDGPPIVVIDVRPGKDNSRQ